MVFPPPEFPAGSFQSVDSATAGERRDWIDDIASLPSLLRDALEGWSDDLLDLKYRNWTIRQIVHHLADSHVNSYVRFKWTLTEDTPTIKAYNEGDWSNLIESQMGSIEPSLLLLDGLHARWCQLLETMTPTQYDRAFIHPESNRQVTLNGALAYYAWHGRHHRGQLIWLREQLAR